MNGGTKVRTWQHGKRSLLAGLAAAAVAVAAFFLLRPAYERYMDQDHAETCGTARFILVRWYQDDVEEQLQQGKKPDEIDYDGTLEKRLEQFGKDFPYFHAEKLAPQEVLALDPQKDGLAAGPDPDETYRITGMCRGGGVDLLTMDVKSRKLDVCCSIHGEYHIDFEPFQ